MSASLAETLPRTDTGRPKGATVTIVVLASCGLLVSLIQTMVVPLLPQFPRLMGVSPSTAAWLVTSTLVSGAVSAPVLGRLGDMYGKRRMLLVSLLLILAGSVVGAVAPNILVLLVGRVLQGASFGVIALGMSLMRDVLPPEKIGGGVGLMSSSLGIGGAVGLPITGLVVQVASWRWLFAGAAVIAVVQILLVRGLVSESRVRTGGRFDVLGAVGLGAALVCLLLGVSKGTEWGWGSPVILGLLLASVVLLVLWGRSQLRRPTPLVDLRVSARPAVLWTNAATVLTGFAIFATFMLATQLLQAPVATGYGFGLSLVAAGVVLLPLGGAMMIFSSTSALISRVRGPRTTLVSGLALTVLGNVGFALLPPSVLLLVVIATVGVIGAALAYSALPLLIMDAVPPTETAAANSLNTLMRQLGTSTCTAVVAAVSTAMVVDVGGDVVPSGGAYTVVFLAAAGAGLAALVIGLLTPAPAGVTDPRDDVLPDRFPQATQPR